MAEPINKRTNATRRAAPEPINRYGTQGDRNPLEKGVKGDRKGRKGRRGRGD